MTIEKNPVVNSQSSLSTVQLFGTGINKPFDQVTFLDKKDALSQIINAPNGLVSSLTEHLAHTEMREPIVSGRGGYATRNPPDSIAIGLQRLMIMGNTIIASREASPGLTEMEFDVREAVLQRLGFAHGGTMVVNSRTQVMIETLRLARDKFCDRYPSISVGAQCLLVPDWDQHHWQTVAETLGFPVANVIAVNTDNTAKMIPAALLDAAQRVSEQGKKVFFWTAHHGAHSIGSGARDRLSVLLDEIHRHSTLFEHAWLHLEGGHGSSALVAEAYCGDAALSKPDSIHIDVKKMGLSLPGRGQIVALKDVNDTKRHVKTEASKYLYHDASERNSETKEVLYSHSNLSSDMNEIEINQSSSDIQNNDIQATDAALKKIRSLGPDSPLCTQSSALAGLWWYLRTNTSEELNEAVTHRGSFANSFMDCCHATEFDRPIEFIEGSEEAAYPNGLVAMKLPEHSQAEIVELVDKALNQYQVEFKLYEFKNESRIAIRFVTDDIDIEKIRYIVSVLEALINNNMRAIDKPDIEIMDDRKGLSSLLPKENEIYLMTYEGHLKEATESKVQDFFEHQGISQYTDNDNVRTEPFEGGMTRERLLKELVVVTHSGPKMSIRNHNQVGGFVLPNAAYRSMETLMRRPNQVELVSANEFLHQFLLSYMNPKNHYENSHTSLRYQSKRGRHAEGATRQTTAITVDSGTIANKESIAAAMQHFEAQATQSHRFDRHKAALFIPETAHYSFEKALEALGMPQDHLIRVPVSNHQYLEVSALKASIQAAEARGLIPAYVAGVYGTTTVGVIDRIDDIQAFVKAYNADSGHHPLWLHVDAAQGFIHQDVNQPYSMSEYPDSLTMDWHKAGLSFNTLATLLIFGEKTFTVASSERHHPERAGIVRNLKDMGQGAGVKEAVLGVRRYAENARKHAEIFKNKVKQDALCPFEIVAGENNSMVAFTLKSDMTEGQCRDEIEERVSQWRLFSRKGSNGEEWAFNLVHLAQRDPVTGESYEIPCLRVNFLNSLHTEETVETTFQQLKQSTIQFLEHHEHTLA